MEQVVGAKIGAKMLCNSILNDVNLMVTCDYHKDDRKVDILILNYYSCEKETKQRITNIIINKFNYKNIHVFFL